MCKCRASVRRTDFKEFVTNTPAGEEESVVGAKANIRIKTPSKTHEFNSGTLYRLPKNQAQDLIERKVPLWIVA